MKPDTGLQTLLDLDGYIYHDDSGFWWKIEAYTIPCTKERPHGIRYNLTLHNRYNKRIMGFDNAHGVSKPKKYTGRIVEYDHIHKDHLDKGTPYTFISAEQLLTDFLSKVDEVIKRETNK